MSRTFKLRTHIRIPITCFVDYVGEGLIGTGVVHDLSADGAQIQGLPSQPVTVGKHLALRITLPNQHTPIEIEAAVVQWVQGHEFGVHIVDMSSEGKARVRRFIESAVNLRHAI